MISVFVARNDALLAPEERELLCARLSPGMVLAAERYRRWQDAQACLWGKYLLAAGLQSFGLIKDVLPELQYTAHKRPYLPVPLDFNISHSGSYVVCAFCTGRAGIDIEQVRPVDVHDFTGCFSAAELSAIQHAPDVYEQFFTYWTIKEAVIKADGRGLGIPLEKITVADRITVDEHTWFVHQLDIAPGYQAHLTTDEVPGAPIQVQYLSLPAG